FNAGTTGKFTANITVPANSAKQAYLVYVSAPSGQTASATYTVTQVVSATVSLSVTSGKAGTVTKLSGSGFQPGEAITVRWGGSSGTVLRTFNAGTTGKFTANITVPKTAVLGTYQIYVSSASGQTASTTYSVTALAYLPIWRDETAA
ncbi:MAG: hypothetical protein KC435_10905, partial [Thermomicrobiales bacterium]|nr:hypothetical protein [Thermomicrobiales bacterium]